MEQTRCACSHASKLGGAKADSEAEENMENEMSTYLCSLLLNYVFDNKCYLKTNTNVFHKINVVS